MSSQTNWAAVSAIAACVGVFVAFLAYATPHPFSTPTQTPWPATTVPSPAQNTTPGNFGAPANPVPSAEPPGGCQQSDAAITTYHNTVGSAWYSRADAALRARDEIQRALSESGGSGPTTSDLQALGTDFQYLYLYAEEENSSSYDTAAAETNTDVQTLDTDCDTR